MFIGTAAWSIPKILAPEFSSEGPHLKRYSQVFNAVEINSSFYREHMAKSYFRWASEVPRNFRFSVKLARALLHDCDLKPKASDVYNSLERIMHLDDKLGVILIQLPASLSFHLKNAERLYRLIRHVYHGPLALEPRNLSWMNSDSIQLMLDYGLSKVLADPERCPGERRDILESGDITYFRLHGSPVIYQSAYSTKAIQDVKKQMDRFKNSWCIFDNTTFGFATENALELKRMVTQYESQINY